MSMAPRKGTRAQAAPFFSIATLAWWQVRPIWRLLVVCGVGILVATILVCIVPLYSQVALSAGLQATLNAASTNSSVNILGTLNGTNDPQATDTMTRQIMQTMQNDLTGTAIAPQAQFIVRVGGTEILSPNLDSPSALARLAANQLSQRALSSLSQIQLVGLEQTQLAAHVHLLQGTLPRPAGNVIEIALLPSTAHCLFLYVPSTSRSSIAKCFSVGVGDTITVVSPFASVTSNAFGRPQFARSATTLRVVGLFTPLNASDPFWQENSFGSTSLAASAGTTLATGLTTSEAFASALSNAVQSARNYVEFNSGVILTWYYHLDVTSIDATASGTLAEEFNAFATDIGNMGGGRASRFDGQFTASGPTDILTEFSSRVAEAQIPIDMLLLLVVGMVVLFISMASALLVEQQTAAIALLHSRGASRRQVFGTFTMQMLTLSLAALIIGPLLAIPLAVLLAQYFFSTPDPGAVALITARPLLSLWNIRWYALFAVGLSLLCTLLTLYQVTRLDVLALRSEASRPTRVPFWQRFYLDGLLIVLALGAYGYAFYSVNTGTLDPATGVQVLSPLIMGASALFLLAGLLLFLRFFPHLVQLIARLAARRSGAAPVIALSQIARTPRQAIRAVLLLTLTTAFAIFALVFSASQAQRVTDMVNYQVGADFSAQLPANTGEQTAPFTVAALNAETTSYRAIPGVLSATMGTMEPAQLGTTALTIKGVDAGTFASTALWTTQDSTQPLSGLMAQLVADRGLAQERLVVPAIVDAETWNALHLSPGQHFTLSLAAIGATGTQIPFVALAEVQHIPTMISTEGGDLSGQGVLVDDQSLSAVFTKATGQSLPINYVWLHTRSDTNSLNSVRAALAQRVPNTGDLAIFDRLALIALLQHDPLTLNLTGVLTIGALTPLLLALLGSLLFSWMSARDRLLSFAILRALGSSPGQLVGVLSWEQGIIYTLMLILGVLYGVLLSLMVLPSLILTSVALPGGSGNAVSTFSFQGDLPTIQIVIPPWLILVLGLLLVTCILTLGLMARIVSRPSISQVLRLNAD